jgi:hypothetical protein
MKRFLIATALALPFLFTACQFDEGIVACEDGTTPGPGPGGTMPATLKELQNQLGAPVQTFTYDPTRANTFTGSKGTIVSIPANAFVRNGQPVAAPVQLALREIFSRADMVLSAMPTVSNGRVLESAGEVYLQPAQDTTLRMAPGTSIRLQTPTPPNVAARDSMQLFIARANASTFCFSWELNMDPGSSLSPTPTGNLLTISGALYNQGIGWFNCDRFYDTPSPQPITVNVPGTDIDPVKNTMVFAVFRAFNGTLKLCDFTAPNVFRTSGVPLGAAVSIIVIRTVNNKLYYGRQDGTVQAGVPFAPTLQETTSADIIANLNTL